MKKVITNVLAIALVGYGMIACNLQNTTLPGAKGLQGEVIVVINRSLWEGACGDSIRSYLAPPVMTLPAPEPMFTLLQQNAITDYFRYFRNMVIINIDPGYETAKLSYKADPWAQGQLVFNLDAPSADSVITCIQRNREAIIAQLLAKDRDSYIAYYKKIADASIAEKLREKFQVDVCIPREYSLATDKENFVWLAREERDMVMGILMWKEPYTSQEQLGADRLIAKMNEVTRQNVEGPSQGSYMTDEPMMPAAVRKFTKDEVYSVQINGLWRTENDFMGGPYVNFSIVDDKRGQIVTGVGFVFFPRDTKRQRIRQLEAIFYTMQPTATEE